MELSEFAGRILLSASLADKIAHVGEFSDSSPLAAVTLPVLPCRSEKLSLDRWRSSPKVPFPSRSDLLKTDQIAVLLHFFANHELLALELMALALLKFPDAPPAFRMGIAHTMRDEQRHLLSYMARMTEFGLEFGDIPLNDFFWSQCASMKTPMDYVCRMSLTFEQANLDFAAYFRDVLGEIGDRRTAALLDDVLIDEMNHVRHGLNWFRRWKTEDASDWQAFCAALGGEINPSRAKGMVFRSDYRKDVGLSEDFISQLHIFSQSKGRPPKAMFFNPEAEEDVRAGGGRAPVLSQALAMTRDDLSPVMLFVSSQADLVVLPREMPTEFMVGLRKTGFLLPEVAVSEISESALKRYLKNKKLSGLLPWSVSPTSMRIEKSIGLGTESVFSGSSAELRWLHSKVTALQLLSEFLSQTEEQDILVDGHSIGIAVDSPEAFDGFIQHFSKSHMESKFVAKRPLSASGRHRIYGAISDGGWSAQPPNVQQWFRKSWQSDEIPLVQPFFERVIDLSMQARIECNGDQVNTFVLGITRVLNAERGQYLGTCVGRFLGDADPELLKFFYGKSFGRSPEEILRDLTVWTGQRLASRGYRGSFGIDAFIFRTADGSLRLYPMIEINARFTMGRVALALSKRMVPGRVGIWLHVTRSMLEKLQLKSFVELRNRWLQDFPLSTHERSGGVVIVGGLLETTPAEQSSQVWTCFLVLKNSIDELKKLGLSEWLPFSADRRSVDKPATRP
jgi:uncharacterized ferritin-like protein (DUF455 family)